MTRLPLLAIAVAVVTAPSGAMSTPPSEFVSVSGPGVLIEASVWSKVAVADTVPLRIEVRTESGVGVEWPGMLVVGGDLGGMTIGRVRELPGALDADGALVTTRVFDLEPFLPGEVTVGPFEFAARDGEGERRTLTLAPMTITIVSALPDAGAAEVSEPKGIVELPEDDSFDWRPVALGGAAALALGAATVGVVMARRLSRTERDITPSQRALAALALLESRVKGEASIGARPTNDQAYTEMSGVLRRYLEDRFAVRAGVLTTEEFFAHATTRSALPADATDALRPLLAACDEVKFGAAEPGMRAAGEAIDQIRAFVERFGDPADARGDAS